MFYFFFFWSYSLRLYSLSILILAADITRLRKVAHLINRIYSYFMHRIFVCFWIYQIRNTITIHVMSVQAVWIQRKVILYSIPIQLLNGLNNRNDEFNVAKVHLDRPNWLAQTTHFYFVFLPGVLKPTLLLYCLTYLWLVALFTRQVPFSIVYVHLLGRSTCG